MAAGSGYRWAQQCGGRIWEEVRTAVWRWDHSQGARASGVSPLANPLTDQLSREALVDTGERERC